MHSNTYSLRFRWTAEDQPGAHWQALLGRAGASYRAWFLREGDVARPGLATCRATLTAYMPEMVPLWERLVSMADGGDKMARMLSLYRPTPYVSGCTQAVSGGAAPFLVRNYDYHPHACEGTFVRTRWLGTTVLGASDCLWGLLDGMNEHGLAVALSFGGSREVGDGFGIPLILRYVLESCATVKEARAVLRRVPSHMAYNVSVLDGSGAFTVAYLRPGAEPEFVRQAVATNHQKRVDWPEYAAVTRSVERKRFAQDLVGSAPSRADLVAAFLKPPLFVTDYTRWHGTLYTAAYDPSSGSANVYWPGASVTQSLDNFTEQECDVPFHTGGAEAREARLAGPPHRVRMK